MWHGDIFYEVHMEGLVACLLGRKTYLVEEHWGI
jgi:hypothetical protein